MKIQGIIHQQICQLRWHLLACLGLIMVLPIEEAVLNFKDGDGFFSSNMTFPAVMFGPLLAGLIACANVQGDLNEKRYIFWRSKPANVKLFVTLKFFVGLIISLLILVCPVVFSIVSSIIFTKNYPEPVLFIYPVALPILIAIMTYSLCFTCNVLVRKTARAWLIGMLIGCFMLVLPFMLPLNLKDIVSDIVLFTFRLYLPMILVTSAAAFVFALYATQHDWHLKTNLRGLLWVGTGLVFLLLMLFSNQVANIRIIGEKEIGRYIKLNKIGKRVVFDGLNYIDVDKKGISINKAGSNDTDVANPPRYGNVGIDSEGRRVTYGPKGKGYRQASYPQRPKALYRNTEDGTYHFGIILYYRLEVDGRKTEFSSEYFYQSFEGEKRKVQFVYERAYLRSYKYIGNSWMVVDELDLSDCFGEKTAKSRRALRLIDNKLIVVINSSCFVVDVTEPGDLKQIDKKIGVIQGSNLALRYMDSQTEFDIPIIPVDGISIEERIKLSIDLMYKFGYHHGIYDSSKVDIHNGKIAFFYVSNEKVVRFDVISWDKEKVYCRFGATRPFTFLEGINLNRYSLFDRAIIEDGKLYLYKESTLLVFDVRSKRRIRKLGHFVHMDWRIEDIAVLEDGNILLCARWNPEDFDIDRLKKADRYYLYLLKNPEWRTKIQRNLK